MHTHEQSRGLSPLQSGHRDQADEQHTGMQSALGIQAIQAARTQRTACVEREAKLLRRQCLRRMCENMLIGLART